MVSRIRNGKAELTAMNAIILAIIIAILGATAIPLVEKSSRQAKSTTLLQNLRTLRTQIELYKLEHNRRVPLLYEGTFPQLIRTTNVKGEPGPPGRKHPYGPYLSSGMPVNPITGRSIVTSTDAFPPDKASGNGGWLYHQQTGRIAADVPQYLSE